MAEDRWEEVGAVLAACEDYWTRNGIPGDKVEEMTEELGQHLREALADGKTAGDVVGADLQGFAEAWAAPNRPSRSLWEETLDVLSDTFVGLAVTVTVAHLVLRAPDLPVELESVLWIAIITVAFARLFAYLRIPAEEPPGSEETVLGSYPKRLYLVVVLILISLYAIYLFVPLPAVVLFVWPWQATLALPVLAVLVRAAKRALPEPLREAPSRPRRAEPENKNQRDEAFEAISDCQFRWATMRIPEDKIEEMSTELQAHIDEAVREGRTVESVTGPDVEEFAEAWAEESGAEPDLSQEPLKHRLQGWVLSITASAAILASFVHVIGWTLYVPVAWIVGMYFFFLGVWFLGDPVANLLDKTRRQGRYAAWKSMLAAGALVLGILGVAVVMAFIFQGLGPVIPFEWPWYATIISAVVAALVVYGWVRDA